MWTSDVQGEVSKKSNIQGGITIIQHQQVLHKTGDGEHSLHGSRSASEGIIGRSASDVEDEVTEVSPRPGNNGIDFLHMRGGI